MGLRDTLINLDNKKEALGRANAQLVSAKEDLEESIAQYGDRLGDYFPLIHDVCERLKRTHEELRKGQRFQRHNLKKKWDQGQIKELEEVIEFLDYPVDKSAEADDIVGLTRKSILYNNRENTYHVSKGSLMLPLLLGTTVGLGAGAVMSICEGFNPVFFVITSGGLAIPYTLFAGGIHLSFSAKRKPLTELSSSLETRASYVQKGLERYRK